MLRRLEQATGQETIGTMLRRRMAWRTQDLHLRMDSRGSKEKGAPKNDMKENGIGRHEECWSCLGERLKTSSRQGDLEGPR